MITLIAAMNSHRIIGVGEKIPWHIPDDFRHFRNYTMGKTLIMGRKTFDSIGGPLPGRKTIILTKNKDTTIDGVTIAHSIDDVLSLISKEEEEAIVAGGANIYEQFLPIAEKMVISLISNSYVSEGIKFPKFNMDNWEKMKTTKYDDFIIDYYERKNNDFK